MVEIPEYKRDDSKDYLYILKSLNEIPFPVGKNLLIDFLIGRFSNPSVQKNDLFEKHNFGSLKELSISEISILIDKLIQEGFVGITSAFFNKNIKVLEITRKGSEELLNPSYGKNDYEYSVSDNSENEMSEDEVDSLKELGDFLKGLNFEQKKAVVSNSKKIICVAGAGTGKTRVLTKRIEFLNKMKKIKGDKILAITFTKKAKEEMKRRLEKMGVQVVVETFNSFSEKILLKNTARIYGRRMRVANYQDKMVALLRALDLLDLKLDDVLGEYFSDAQMKSKTKYELQSIFLNDCFSILDYYRSGNKTLDEIFSNGNSKEVDISNLIKEIISIIDKNLKMVGLRTYSDQITDTIEFFKKYPKKIPEFEHILVDEFQDVNNSQIELLNLLNSYNLFVVGDPRQSIFGWRGSNLKYVFEMLNDDAVQVVELSKNYRSSSKIIEFMNESVKDMKFPDLVSTIDVETSINLYKFNDELSEINFVANEILNSESKRKDIFVLARTNNQLKEASKIFTKKKIPHILKLDESELKDAREGEVVLSTIHSIKGLEAEEVYVFGINLKNFPPRVSEHPIMELVKNEDYDKIEEEKRLFYVAISRAKKKLVLSYSNKNHTYFVTDKMKELFDSVESVDD